MLRVFMDSTIRLGLGSPSHSLSTHMQTGFLPFLDWSLLSGNSPRSR